jgi:hypothetical protein
MSSTGVTLESATIDLLEVFAPGQSYVALSRLKDALKLQILGRKVTPLSALVRRWLYSYELGGVRAMADLMLYSEPWFEPILEMKEWNEEFQVKEEYQRMQQWWRGFAQSRRRAIVQTLIRGAIPRPRTYTMPPLPPLPPLLPVTSTRVTDADTGAASPFAGTVGGIPIQSTRQPQFLSARTLHASMEALRASQAAVCALSDSFFASPIYDRNVFEDILQMAFPQ